MTVDSNVKIIKTDNVCGICGNATALETPEYRLKIRPVCDDCLWTPLTKISLMVPHRIPLFFKGRPWLLVTGDNEPSSEFDFGSFAVSPVTVGFDKRHKGT